MYELFQMDCLISISGIKANKLQTENFVFKLKQLSRLKKI